MTAQRCLAVQQTCATQQHNMQWHVRMNQVRAEATAAARRELDSQLKGVEKGREEIRALQDRLAQAQQDNTKQGHLLAVQAADLDQRAAKITKQEVGSQCCLTKDPTLTYSTLS